MIEYRAEKRASREDENKIRCSGPAQIGVGAYNTSTSFHIRTFDDVMTFFEGRGSQRLHSPRRTVSGIHVKAVSICDGLRTASGLR